MSTTDLRDELKFPQPPGFPPEVREVFDPLRREVTFLHGTWDTYRQLFGTEESIAALNSTAPGAFSILGYVMRRDIIMTICRITDPKATGKKENLTLERLLYVISSQSKDADFVARLQSRLDEINIECRAFRDRRNRSVGHLDLQTVLETHAEKLPAIENTQIADAMRRIAEFMNEILHHYKGVHADFVPVVSGPARNIVHGLREFQRLRKLETAGQTVESTTSNSTLPEVPNASG